MTPPAILLIVQERLRAGAEQAYGRLEEQFASASESLGVPNAYLALASITPPTEVWWLTAYESEAAIASIRRHTPATDHLRPPCIGWQLPKRE